MSSPSESPSPPKPRPSGSGHARLVEWLIDEIERPGSDPRPVDPSEGRVGFWVLDYHVREVEAGGDCSCDGRALPLFEAYDLQRLSARWRLNVFSLMRQWGQAFPPSTPSPERLEREARPSYYAFMGKREPPAEEDPDDVEWCRRLRARMQAAIEAALAIGPIVQPQPQPLPQQQQTQQAAEQMSDVAAPAAQPQVQSQAAAPARATAASPVAPTQPRRSPQPPSQQLLQQQQQWQQQQQQQWQQHQQHQQQPQRQQRSPSVEEHKSYQQPQRQSFAAPAPSFRLNSSNSQLRHPMGPVNGRLVSYTQAY